MNTICLSVAIFRYDAEAALLGLVLALRMMRRVVRFVVMCLVVFWYVASSPPMRRSYQFIWRLISGRLELLADQIPLIVQLLLQAAIAIARTYQQQASHPDPAVAAEPEQSVAPRSAALEHHAPPAPVVTASKSRPCPPASASTQTAPDPAPVPRRTSPKAKAKPNKAACAQRQPKLKELQRRAAEAKIRGRSSMNKEELGRALCSAGYSEFCQIESRT